MNEITPKRVCRLLEGMCLLDFDTQNQFFNMSGDFIYSAILLRNYVMLSNQQLRSISYQLFIAYLDGSEEEYKIPPAQNASIKFEFNRIY